MIGGGDMNDRAGENGQGECEQGPAEFAQQRLMFVIGALRQLLADENVTNLLRAERLDTLPKYLAERVWSASTAV